MKKTLCALLILVLVLILVAGSYVVYVFIDYSRLEDSISLETRNAHAPDSLEAELLTVGEEKSIITYNVGFGAYKDDFSFFMDGGKESRARSEAYCRENIDRCISVLQNADPDFLLLQEVDIEGDRSCDVNQREAFEAAFPGFSSSVFAQNYDSSYLFYPFHQPIGAAKSGIITMTNARIESALRRRLPIESGFNKFFDLDRCYSISRIPTDNGKTLCLFNLHLSAYTSDGTIATEQLQLILQDMQAEYAAGNYVIAGGDFNKDLWGDSAAVTGIPGEDASWCQPFPTELLPESISLVDSLNPEYPVLSCRDTGAPYTKGTSFEVTLDGFLVSDNVQVTECSVIDAGFLGSDHNPVQMKFKLL